jgi:hypothetical protein
MADVDLTHVILREIRDEIVTTRTELKAEISAVRTEVTARLDATNERLDVTNERLGVVEYTMQDLASQMLIVSRYVKNTAARNDEAIEDLRTRVDKLEAG